MALTSAEKQKRYRERLKQNTAKYEEAKKKHREHYHKTKRLVKDLTPKEKRAANTIWKLRQREYRKKQKNLQNILNVTPPSSPVSAEILRDHTPPIEEPPMSPRERGRKKVKRDRSKLYRENEKLKEKLKKIEKKCDKYRKRCIRSKQSQKDEHGTDNVKQKYKLLTNSIRQRYQNIKSHKEKSLFKSVLKNTMIEISGKKRELLKEAFGVNREYRKKSSTCDRMQLRLKIHRFFLRDDISRPSAGKKETKTRYGKKVQKRYLLDTKKHLYVKNFLPENPGVKCSYYYFTKHCPFFVVKLSVAARETCLCKIHTNCALKAKALRKQGIINTDDLNKIIEESVCNDRYKDCMYSNCATCENKHIAYNLDKISGTTIYSQWIRKEENYDKDGKKVKTIKNVKEELTDDTEHFVATFENDMLMFKKHVYNIKVQFHNFRESLNNLQPNECVVVVDFSENYACKYQEEVQSHHFGGSRNQVTLHTVMVYTYDADKNYNKHSFCTISSSNSHQPAAIWSHLDPILNWIRIEHPEVDTVHYFSDGPTTQYRQKQNFYLLCTKFFDYGFTATSWSFFEAGHGKGPADGIGGYLKRTADSMVASGQDIANAIQFYERLRFASKIRLFLIEEDVIGQIENQLPKSIPRLVGTLKVHHVFTQERNSLKYRPLSCFCVSTKRGFCNCLDPKIYNVNIEPTTVQKVREEINTETISNRTVLVEDIGSVMVAQSSDEEMPLSSLAALKEIQNTLPRQSIYKSIYGSSSESDGEVEVARQPSGHNKENSQQMPTDKCLGNIQMLDGQQASTSYNSMFNSRQISVGDYLHVNVHCHDTKHKKTYSYVCRALTSVEEDGEVKVMFLRVASKNNAKRYRLEEKDISYVDFNDIIKILPVPAVIKKGSRTYYEFKNSIDVFEK